MNRWIAMCCAIMAFFGCTPLSAHAEALALSTPQPTVEASKQVRVIKGHVQTQDGKYLLSPGDHINVSVYGAPEFDQNDLVIRPDGYVTIKPLGEINAAGADIDGLTGAIEDGLRRYLKNPEVSLSVTQFHPAIVYVLGEVQKPGAYEIHGDIEQPDSPNAVLARGRLTVSNLIANAGGITQRADVRQVTVKNNETHKQRTVDLVRMLKDGETSQDVMIHSGDTIYVPALQSQAQLDDDTLRLLSQSALAPGTFTVRVLGKVNTPGVYPINAQSPGIHSAIASARGYLIEANQQKVRVLRKNGQGDNRLSVITVDPTQSDFMLRDNDVVVVDERRVPIAGRLWDYSTRAVLPFLTMGNFANSVMDLLKPGRRFPVNTNR